MYAIYDSVAAVFNKPFTEHNDESAKRSFTQAAAEQPHILDYSLYHIGEYDDHSGIITPCHEPVRIVSGLEIKPTTISSITPEQQINDLKQA